MNFVSACAENSRRGRGGGGGGGGGRRGGGEMEKERQDEVKGIAERKVKESESND